MRKSTSHSARSTRLKRLALGAGVALTAAVATVPTAQLVASRVLAQELAPVAADDLAGEQDPAYYASVEAAPEAAPDTAAVDQTRTAGTAPTGGTATSGAPVAVDPRTVSPAPGATPSAAGTPREVPIQYQDASIQEQKRAANAANSGTTGAGSPTRTPNAPSR